LENLQQNTDKINSKPPEAEVANTNGKLPQQLQEPSPEPLEPDIFIGAEHFRRVIELSNNDCTLASNDAFPELLSLCGSDLGFSLSGLKHWRCNLESHTNLRFLTNAIPSGSYIIMWHFAYTVSTDQGSLSPDMIQHNCTAGIPVNPAMFLARIKDPNQAYISQGMNAIMNPFVLQSSFLPLQTLIPDMGWDICGLLMQREGATSVVNGQIIDVEQGKDFCFLVKRVKFSPVIKGTLMFLGVDLVRTPLMPRPDLVL